MIAGVLWLGLLLQPQAAEPAVPPAALALLQAGSTAESRQDFDKAISSYRLATEIAPSSAVVFLRLGNAYMQMRDYAAALAPLRKAAELSPDMLTVQQLLGFALLTQGYSAEAIPHLQAAHEDGALGIAQLQNNQPGEAIGHLQAALAKTPGDPDLLYYLSRAATALSAQSSDKLLSTYPDSARGHQVMGQNYYSAKMYPSAEQEYLKAIALRPDLPGLRLELGQVFAANSEWKKAEDQFRGETQLQPWSAEAAYNLGNALLHQGKMTEATNELRRSDAIMPDMSETLYELGQSEASSDPASAEKAFDHVIELEKNTPLAAEAHFALAGIHRKQGKTEQATKDMQEFQNIEALNERH
jgi:tetratricopeptide (TPR) repeat protein